MDTREGRFLRASRALVLGIVALLLMGPVRAHAQEPSGTADYPSLIKKSVFRDYPGMLHPPTGVLAHPFITPGSVYATELWDWDSWLSDVALSQIMTDQGLDTDKQKMVSYGRGCVLNFIQAAEADGSLPIRIRVEGDTAGKRASTQGAGRSNIHKPVLAQHAAFLVKLDDGNAQWLREGFRCSRPFRGTTASTSTTQPTGLYFWKDDLAIGVDTDPATFFRPPRSSASVFLNCLMFKELSAMAYLARRLELDHRIAEGYDKRAGDLKAAIQKHCWDERDGYFYSVDLNLRPDHQRARRLPRFPLRSSQGPPP